MAHKNPVLLAVLLAVLIGLLAVHVVDTLRLTNPRKYEIAVVLKTNNIHSDYWQMVSSGVKAAAKEFDIHIGITGPLSETDTDEQIRNLNEVLAGKPDAIILAATDAEKLAPMAKKIKESGAKLILIESRIHRAEGESLIATDNFEEGKKIGMSLTGIRNGGHGKVLVISDRKSLWAEEEREQGFKEAIASLAGVENAGTFYFDSTEDAAYEQVKKLLSLFPDVQGIAGLNEEATLGAARALKEYKRTDHVNLVGFGSSIYQVKLLEEGRLQATIVQKPFNMGYLSVETAVKILNGMKVEPINKMKALVITKDNMYTQQNQELLFPLVEK
ncbi:substrate-binding domain-containing protein [Paenibacillus aceris]|uniref:Ribose transport system substrate-binding protein n=1 Tax=Paenibacillus aceris TaxID=869555 RepID=A0ABS4HVK6_9BACL|nr:substrate-binding domain-containing protein [Paenibacillus aceris]MBP1962256.1 ribose transport system substrate-binding protein [Paenibacillus aceris]NHW37083.1 substrate-binding domain-containing protein [Paenibacillus aceris]